jgi:hypothetical protein
MELGNFGKHTILTGAGWSHNWGARLAADVWQLLMDNPAIAKRERLRALLLEEGLFEVALAKAQTPPFTADERESFERALIDAFVSMDRPPPLITASPSYSAHGRDSLADVA